MKLTILFILILVGCSFAQIPNRKIITPNSAQPNQPTTIINSGGRQSSAPVTQETKNGEKQSDPWVWGWDAVMALATIVIVCLTFWQYREFRKSNERQLRAYVATRVADDRCVEKFENGRTKLFFRPFIKNAGQTPAYEMKCDMDVDKFAYPLPADFKYPNFKKQISYKIDLAPGEEIQFERAFPEMTNNAFTDLMHSQDTRIYVYGFITYKDAFDVQRETEFSYNVVMSDLMSGGQRKFRCDWRANDGNRTT